VRFAGHLRKEDFLRGLSALGFSGDAQDVFHEIDLDSDGIITYDEFAKFFVIRSQNGTSGSPVTAIFCDVGASVQAALAPLGVGAGLQAFGDEQNDTVNQTRVKWNYAEEQSEADLLVDSKLRQEVERAVLEALARLRNDSVPSSMEPKMQTQEAKFETGLGDSLKQKLDGLSSQMAEFATIVEDYGNELGRSKERIEKVEVLGCAQANEIRKIKDRFEKVEALGSAQVSELCKAKDRLTAVEVSLAEELRDAKERLELTMNEFNAGRERIAAVEECFRSFGMELQMLKEETGRCMTGRSDMRAGTERDHLLRNAVSEMRNILDTHMIDFEAFKQSAINDKRNIQLILDSNELLSMKFKEIKEQIRYDAGSAQVPQGALTADAINQRRPGCDDLDAKSLMTELVSLSDVPAPAELRYPASLWQKLGPMDGSASVAVPVYMPGIGQLPGSKLAAASGCSLETVPAGPKQRTSNNQFERCVGPPRGTVDRQQSPLREQSRSRLTQTLRASMSPPRPLPGCFHPGYGSPVQVVQEPKESMVQSLLASEKIVSQQGNSRMPLRMGGSVQAPPAQIGTPLGGSIQAPPAQAAATPTVPYMHVQHSQFAPVYAQAHVAPQAHVVPLSARSSLKRRDGSPAFASPGRREGSPRSKTVS